MERHSTAAARVALDERATDDAASASTTASAAADEAAREHDASADEPEHTRDDTRAEASPSMAERAVLCVWLKESTAHAAEHEAEAACSAAAVCDADARDADVRADEAAVAEAARQQGGESAAAKAEAAALCAARESNRQQTFARKAEAQIAPNGRLLDVEHHKVPVESCLVREVGVRDRRQHRLSTIRSALSKSYRDHSEQGVESELARSIRLADTNICKTAGDR